MTYNVNYGIPGDPQSIQAIRDADPDLVFLQETTPAWEAALREALQPQYAHMRFEHHGRAGGLAVLSKVPLKIEILERSAPSGRFPAMRVLAQWPWGSFQALNVHLHPPASASGSFISGYFSTPKIRKAELKGFAKHLEPDLPTVVLGDFNESGGSAIKHLAKQGYGNALQEFQPGAKTWHWPTIVGEIYATLDHVMYDRRWVPLSTRVLKLGRSDHWPVLARLELVALPR